MTDKSVSRRDPSNTILPPIAVHPLDLDRHVARSRPEPAGVVNDSCVTAQAGSDHGRPVGREHTVR